MDNDRLLDDYNDNGYISDSEIIPLNEEPLPESERPRKDGPGGE